MKKTSIITYLFILFTIHGLKGQTMNCEIKGTFVDITKYKYVYLVDLQLNFFIEAPIYKNQFSFNIAKPESYKAIQLYLEEDSIKTIDHFIEKSKTLSQNRRIFAIENADLLFGKDAQNVKVNYGELNGDINQMYKAMETKDFQAFFEQHPNSEISITLLKSLLSLNRVFENTYDCKSFYNKLSERIKNSPEGKELFSKL